MNSWKDYTKTVITTLRSSFDVLMVSNILWFVLTVLIITIPPAYAGLYYATNRLAHDETVSRSTFFEGFQKYLRVSYVWFLLNVVVVGFAIYNIYLSTQFNQTWILVLSGFNWILVAVWMLLQIYTFPFLIEQDKPSLFHALRKSAGLWLKHGIFNFSLAVVIGILAVISVFIPPLWFIITAGLITYLANLAMVFLLSKE